MDNLSESSIETLADDVKNRLSELLTDKNSVLSEDTKIALGFQGIRIPNFCTAY